MKQRGERVDVEALERVEVLREQRVPLAVRRLRPPVVGRTCSGHRRAAALEGTIEAAAC